MTVLEVSIVVIMIANVLLLGAITMLLLRLGKTVDQVEGVLRDHAVPMIDKLHAVADQVHGVAEQVQHIAGDARQVEQRVAGAANQIIDQIEPPVRQIAALLAGVRAGVGRLFEVSPRGRAVGATMRPDMRKE